MVHAVAQVVSVALVVSMVQAGDVVPTFKEVVVQVVVDQVVQAVVDQVVQVVVDQVVLVGTVRIVMEAMAAMEVIVRISAPLPPRAAAALAPPNSVQPLIAPLSLAPQWPALLWPAPLWPARLWPAPLWIAPAPIEVRLVLP